MCNRLPTGHVSRGRQSGMTVAACCREPLQILRAEHLKDYIPDVNLYEGPHSSAY